MKSTLRHFQSVAMICMGAYLDEAKKNLFHMLPDFDTHCKHTAQLHADFLWKFAVQNNVYEDIRTLGPSTGPWIRCVLRKKWSNSGSDCCNDSSLTRHFAEMETWLWAWKVSKMAMTMCKTIQRKDSFELNVCIINACLKCLGVIEFTFGWNCSVH